MNFRHVFIKNMEKRETEGERERERERESEHTKLKQ